MSFQSALDNLDRDSPLIELQNEEIISAGSLIESLQKDTKSLKLLGVKKLIIGSEANFENLYSSILGLYSRIKIKFVSNIQDVSSIHNEEIKKIISKSISLLSENAFPNHENNFALGIEFLTKTKKISKNSFELELTTSGTSGNPKTVLLEENDLIYQAETVSELLNLMPSSRQFFYMPVNYIYGLSIITTSILSGGCLVIPRNNIKNPNSFFDELIERDITVFSGVPYTYNVLSKWGAAKLQKSKLSSLTQAGGRLRLDTKKKIISSIPNIDFWVMYGQTEFGGRISQYKLDEKIDNQEFCVGKPLRGIKTFIKSEENESGLGEIFLSSPSTCKNINELIKPIEINGEKYYSTGDVGNLVDGFLYVSDRNKNFIKIGGSRISSASIQNFFRDFDSIKESFICSNIGRTEKILIGLHSDNFVDIQTQWELSGVIDEKSNLTNILENKPFEIFLLHGPLPLLDNGKTCIWKIFEIMREASIEKKSLHIWL
tara:strand:- start:9653 stop:11119 length:1467 start_codon:yes stop_codon:yes gene_type:complete